MLKQAKLNINKLIVALLIGIAVVVGSYPALATRNTSAVTGSGEAISMDLVAFVDQQREIKNISSINTVGNKFTFKIDAKINEQSRVEGSMQLIDHTLGLKIASNVASLIIPNPNFSKPVGSIGGLTASLNSSGDSVYVNGELKTGWRLNNTPLFDSKIDKQMSGGDTVSFAISDNTGRKIYQWTGILLSGNLHIVSEISPPN